MNRKALGEEKLLENVRWFPLKKEEAKVLFVFYSDFSDNDISNFRVAFSVPDNTETRTMSPQWEKAYKRMNHRNDDKEYSYLIKLSNKATIENIWGF